MLSERVSKIGPRPSALRTGLRAAFIAVLWFAVGACQGASAVERSGPTLAHGGVSGEAGLRARATPPRARVDAGATVPKSPAPLPTRFPAAARIVALGDVHGDLSATRAALRLAGALGERSDDWVGGELVVVQTGDQLDRGDQEIEILALLDSLAEQAAKAGGAVHVLNGNHEFMNALGDLRYVTAGGLSQFRNEAGLNVADPRLAMRPLEQRARLAAFLPGGPFALRLGARNTVVIVGRTVFVHGGILPKHVAHGLADLEQLNAEARAWLSGTAKDPAAVVAQIMDPQSVVWTRYYAADGPEVCATLVQALNRMDVDRMVVGHTVQLGGVTRGCAGRLWRIDVGMARHYGGSPQVLVIAGDEVSALGG